MALMSDLKVDSATFCSTSTISPTVTIVVDAQLIPGALAEADQRHQVAPIDHLDHRDRCREVPVLSQLEWLEAEDLEASVGAYRQETLVGVVAEA